MNNEENNFKKSSSNFFKLFIGKIKKIKHLDIILTVLLVAIILLIYFSTFSSKTSNLNISENKTLVENKESVSTSELYRYSKEIEEKISHVVSSIKDAGNVEVAVKLSGGIEYVYAYTTKTETLENGTKVETKTPILITKDNISTPMVLQTIMPNVERIVIFASGAKNTNVKLDILRAVQLLYDLPSSKIEIFAGN